MRFEDSPGLFGEDFGTSTSGEFQCEICKKIYNEGLEEDGDSIKETIFIGLNICEECFEKIEREIIKRMPQILKWYRRILENQSKFTKEKLIELNKTDPNTKMSKIFNKEG